MVFQFKKAIVTGGAGFIGSHICEELLKLGVEVVSIDNYMGGKAKNVAHLKSNPKFQEVNCDVTNYDELKKNFKDVDVVFHNAASKKTICLKDPRKDLEINAKGTFNMLELSRDFDVKKFVHASTGSVYGEAIKFPQDENHPLIPTSYYGVSKLAGEKYAKVFEYLYSLNTTVLRYFHVYGPRQESADNKGGVIAIFIRRLLEGKSPIIFGDGLQERSFTYVSDVVRANLLVAQKKETKGELYNLASGIKVKLIDMTKKLMKLLDKEDVEIKYGPPTPGDIKIVDIDNSKLKSLGFEFKTDLEQGLKETIEYFKRN